MPLSGPNRVSERAAIQQRMKHWQQDPDFAGIRDAAVLVKFPAGEQKAFRVNVAGLVKKASRK